MVTLVSNDNKKFEVPKDVAYKSVLIKNMVEDIGDENAEIPLPRAQASVLEKVIDYCTYHKDDPPLPAPVQKTQDDQPDRIRRTTDIIEWDYNFMNLENPVIFEIMLLANYLDIVPLFELTCKTVANKIKGKSPEQLREIFGIENDFTPEQLDEIRRENEWAEDP
ncbi:uncharacterized protein SAPINGB_P000689 [Magnusiomyces paraingens]|uniref:E3 ubiquitin ligase complex SCF subunit n=1 Tax=Magnusiomyces paraingens TaxID=2606893 RepID=A0A5E8B191_9ASCO|nr:uncharacterized protein SAPINGB_P000689 [Saprochaete ingens]VVT45255.1 unnamed protein product [Saprochaete ingens]